MPQKKGVVSKDHVQNQWIAFVSESCLSTTEDGQKPSFCKLRHPRTDQAAMFLFSSDNQQLNEVLRFAEPHRSWFIEDTVQQDGSLFITTTVDPLYFILPYLMKGQEGKFMQLDQIVYDHDYPECSRLCSCEDNINLSHIADKKGADDLKVYRYSKDKTLAWLRCKVEQVADELEERKVQTSGSSHAMFVKSAKSCSRDDSIRYAHGIVSDYLPHNLSEDLKLIMDIKEILNHEKPALEEEPKAKKPKIEGGPLEDYSQNNGNGLDSKKGGKMTVAQKKLEKVDKSGMKSISSFFSPKPTKSKKN